MITATSFQRLLVLLGVTVVCFTVYNLQLHVHKQKQLRHEEHEESAFKMQRRNVSLGPVEKRCPMYQEFRYLDFFHPTLRHRLCRNVEAYRRYPDGFPVCQLPSPFNVDMLSIVRLGSDILKIVVDACKKPIEIFGYKGSDYISNAIRINQSWEQEIVNWTLQFALKVPQVTFLDMGSNIGVYSIQAAKLGLPVVALDANIRNLLRLRLSLNAASLDADLVWNYISHGEQLVYLNLPTDCNVGAVGKVREGLPDTVPVMPLRSERITSLIKTKNVVMKIDLEGGEADFMRMSGRLFTDFNVVAVQMEWQPMFFPHEVGAYIINFFQSRGYKGWQIPNVQSLNVSASVYWNENIVWVHKNFVNLM